MDLTQIPTPCYVCDEQKLIRNLEILKSVQERSGCTIILALKGFAMHSLFPTIRQYLGGTTASSLNEAHLGYEEFKKEVHVYAPAYLPQEFDEMLTYVDHIVFNSFSQWKQFRPHMKQSSKPVSCGIRVNPEHREVETALYDPCSPFSRLGVPENAFNFDEFQELDGLHFHTLCEKNSDSLERTLEVIEQKFEKALYHAKWVNFGGGHHITREDYDVDLLCELVQHVKQKYDVKVYLEPGEAVALNAGIMVASVLDTMHNGMDIAILDTSASNHMPDVLEMPYRPEIFGAGSRGEHPYTYRLTGLTCLAGDIIGDYSFPSPLNVGDKLVFGDMLHYSMVKNTTFNGVGLPSIGIWKTNQTFELVKTFGYEEYRDRLS